MTHIAAVATALPEHCYSQSEITEALLPLIMQPAHVAAAGGARVAADPTPPASVVRRIHSAAGVTTRHLAMPLDFYARPFDFGEANTVFLGVGARLAATAVMDALARAGCAARDIDFVFFTTVTGVSAPSLDAAVIMACGLRPDVKRVPSFGLGCAGGAAGLARVHDYLVGHPHERGLLVSVELCSLTLQDDDPSTANIVASGLFGDGAAAVVLCGNAVGGGAISASPRILGTRSALIADTERALGWDVGATGFRIVLGVEVPAVVEAHLAATVSQLLGEHGLGLDDVDVWLAHPGGPKVLDAMQSALRLPAAALDVSWRSLARVGNLSSASVLHILADVMHAAPRPGAIGVLFAVGPGVTVETVLMRWQAA